MIGVDLQKTDASTVAIARRHLAREWAKEHGDAPHRETQERVNGVLRISWGHAETKPTNWLRWFYSLLALALAIAAIVAVVSSNIVGGLFCIIASMYAGYMFDRVGKPS